MPIKGENGGYKYKAFFNGEWHDLTLSDSPNELTEWLQSNEEWTRVKHGHWIDGNGKPVSWDDMNIGCPSDSCYCSECGDWLTASDEYPAKGYYCPNCGAKMDEVEDGKID